MTAKRKVKRLVRPKKGKKVAGVCIGLANFFDIDPTIVRLIWIFLLIPGGIPGLVPYLICWFIIPKE